MAPLDTSSDILSLIASPTQTSGEVSPPENTTQPAPKTVFGVVFALGEFSCFNDLLPTLTPFPDI